MTDILWEYTYRVVPNIKDSNYESNAQLCECCHFFRSVVPNIKDSNYESNAQQQ